MESPLAVINILVAVELEELTIQVIHLIPEELAEEELRVLPHHQPLQVKLEMITLEAVEAEMVKDQLKLVYLEQEDLV
jgi:homoserine trans-succinylase